MADYTDNALLAAIKALDSAVMPAVDTADPLASEQLRLVSGYLKFLRQRVPMLTQRHRFELQHYLLIGWALLDDARVASGVIADRLAPALASAQAVLDGPDASVAAMREATSALASAINALARLSGSIEAPTRRRIEHTIATMSKRWVDMQRAWFSPLGFELRPQELPALDAIFAAAATDAASGPRG